MFRQIIKGFVKKHSGNCLAYKNLPCQSLVFKFKLGYNNRHGYDSDNRRVGFLPEVILNETTRVRVLFGMVDDGEMGQK